MHERRGERRAVCGAVAVPRVRDVVLDVAALIDQCVKSNHIEQIANSESNANANCKSFCKS